jgi:glucan 1,3-beta-glucosidase
MVRARILVQRTRLSTECFYVAYNHSGKVGQINFLYGIMGMANAQRTLNYIRIITEFISQDEWKDVVVSFGIINEALITTIGTEELRGL